MKGIKVLYLAMTALFLGFALVGAKENKSDTKKEKAKPTAPAKPAKATLDTSKATLDTSKATLDTSKAMLGADDEAWLNTIWGQVDDVVKKKELKLQETVTVAGVRGAEAEVDLLDKLYYKGGKRYPTQDKLRKAIDALKENIAADPKGEDAPQMKYFVGQCYEKLGNISEAKNYYNQVIKNHSKSASAPKAQKSLEALVAGK